MTIQKIVELKHVSVAYKEKKSWFKSQYYTALKDISFDVYRGETLGVIGKNGAGKSTLLRVLAGIIKPDSGEIKFHTKSISLMALQAGFDMNLSGRQNAIISSMFLGFTKQESINKLSEIKNFSELGEFFEKPIKTYSSGMKARLGFSIAMFTTPDILLIDEVLGVGDANFRRKAEKAIHEKISSNTTVVIVSHSEHQVSSIADRVVWIQDGVVKKVGMAKEVYPEFNLYANFSSQGVELDVISSDEDFVVIYEKISREKDIFHFNIVVLSKNSTKVEEAKIIYTDKSQIELKGPTESPAFFEKFPEMKNSKKARFHKGVFKIGQKNSIVVLVNGEYKEVVSLNLENKE